MTPAETAKPFYQGFADARHSGTRHGPVHLFAVVRLISKVPRPLCGRRVKRWNFEGETDSDFCPKCLRLASASK